MERSCLLLWLDNDNTQVGQFIIVIVEGFVNLNFHIGKHILQQSLQSKVSWLYQFELLFIFLYSLYYEDYFIYNSGLKHIEL